MLAPGDRLDLGFELTVVQDGSSRTVRFGELITRPTVISVYMRNGTGTCDRQTDALLRVAPELGQAGFNLIAVSRDTATSHVRYGARKAIPYLLASDPGDLFARAAGAIVEKSMYGKKYLGPARCAFVLAPGGNILAGLAKVDAATHDQQLRELIGSLRRA